MTDLARIVPGFLETVPTIGLATVDGEGRPHAANVNFVSDDDLNLYFLSNPASAHSRHVAARERVAATAYSGFTRPDEIRGVQLHGTCELLDESRFDEVWAAFLGKFPYAEGFADLVREEERFYVLRTDWVRWIDNSVSFGFKLESDWPPA